jgi:hypothetical protein
VPLPKHNSAPKGFPSVIKGMWTHRTPDRKTRPAKEDCQAISTAYDEFLSSSGPVVGDEAGRSSARKLIHAITSFSSGVSFSTN